MLFLGLLGKIKLRKEGILYLNKLPFQSSLNWLLHSSAKLACCTLQEDKSIPVFCSFRILRVSY